MKPEQPSAPGTTDGHNQGEGDRVSARHYNEQLREFIAQHRVASSAPRAARVSLDELVAMGRTVVDRIQPYVERIVGRLRARFLRR